MRCHRLCLQAEADRLQALDEYGSEEQSLWVTL